MTRAIILDCETTSQVDPEPIEIAYCVVNSPVSTHGEIFCQRYKPTKSIQFGAIAVHHIFEDELADCPPVGSFVMPECDYLIGHSVDYDHKAIGSPDVKRICTYAMARELWPEYDSHSLVALIYRIYGKMMRETIREAHSASVDVMLTGMLLKAMNFGDTDFESIWEFSERARIPRIWNFGKHKGMVIAASPVDYRQWMLKQTDIDPYLRKAIEDSMRQKKMFR